MFVLKENIKLKITKTQNPYVINSTKIALAQKSRR